MCNEMTRKDAAGAASVRPRRIPVWPKSDTKDLRSLGMDQALAVVQNATVRILLNVSDQEG